MDHRDDPNHHTDQSGEPLPVIELEIDTSRKRRWMNWVLYVLAFLALSALLVWFFVMLNTTLALAIAVVTFMVVYMVVMGYVAGKGQDERRNTF